MSVSESISSPPERVEELSKALGTALSEDLASIRNVNTTLRLLSVNARIEAAKAGSSGATFAVVAQEVATLAKSMDGSFRNLETRTSPLLRELESTGAHLARDVRGQRLADLAAVHLDLIDRNLYERSCDVRWWATDGGLVKALETLSSADLEFASRRMGTILDSYTVYFDLLLCDLNGRILVNGRPGRYPCQGMDASGQEWFRSAKATRDGSEFGFESVHASRYTGDERVLVYSTAVRQAGLEKDDPIGVLGVVFRWNALGQTIVENADLDPEERRRTEVLVLDSAGKVLACSSRFRSEHSYPVHNWLAHSNRARFHFIAESNTVRQIVAVARSQGYETYATGWVSALVQHL